MVWRKVVATTVLTLSGTMSLYGSCVGDSPQVLVALGAAGESEYGSIFRACGERWKTAFGEDSITILDGTESDPNSHASANNPLAPESDIQALNNEINHRQQILDWISNGRNSSGTANDLAANATNSQQTRWIVLIGHGTSDRTGSKFNLAGPDLSAKDLGAALNKTNDRWIIINCSSSSGPFLAELSNKDRIVITATKSGAEQNYSRFADYLSRALTDPKSDLDHDSQISVLEAFLSASSGVARFYQDEGRLASEQALLDDNGDKRGTPALFFRGLRAVKAPSDGLKLDGEFSKRIVLARLGNATPLTQENLAEVKQIEEEIESLRKNKGTIEELEYANRLENLLLRLADLLIPLEVNP